MKPLKKNKYTNDEWNHKRIDPTITYSKEDDLSE